MYFAFVSVGTCRMARDRGSFSNATLLTVGGVSAWMVIEVRAVQLEKAYLPI